VIIFLCDQAHAYTLGQLTAAPGKRAHIAVRSYSWLFAQARLPGATYIFTDHERLADHELSAAARAFRIMRQAGLTVLNDPAMVRVRLDLLEELFRRGINDFTAYRAASRPQPRRFPVFLRKETDHSVFSEELLGDQAALDARLAALEQDGIPLRHVLVVEFSAAPDRPGVYRKHAVFKIGDRLLAYPPVAEDRWLVKFGTKGLATDADLAAAVKVMESNPFAERLAPAFEIARIDYGRADFGLVDGRLSVFEINTNPGVNRLAAHRDPTYLAATQRVFDTVVAAVDELDTSPPPVPVTWDFPRAPRLRRLFGHVLKRP
jgi:hypothetical protein